ncbi:macrophage mannose receptor 1-like isoform X2 [Sparus aurata]|uniref:Macrophage mannose receptor 1-like n=2 Tax=Sparus aurata TaxID=8175 RepID=A0A671WMJ7_SPAAU|nr:macrophage mannose receptor 1-like isoform X2 [Sparus aurata]
MDCYATLILLFFGFSFSSCYRFPLRKYYYINTLMTWSDAQHYCREKYTDLATFESVDDFKRLKPDFSYSWAWIGLKDDPKSWKGVMGNDTNSWRWSATSKTSQTGYHNWKGGDPNSGGGKENCVIMGSTRGWHDVSCQSLKSFVCYTATNQNEKTYVFISASKTWHSAQAYCREHYTDLPTIENTKENSDVYSAKPGNAQAWIGLYRVPWTWSDNTQSSFRFWRSGCPDNYLGNQFCVVENSLHEWNDINCPYKFPFICHQVLRLRTMIKMKIQSDADLADPATNIQILKQLGAELTSKGWTDFNLQWKMQPRKQEEKKLGEY